MKIIMLSALAVFSLTVGSSAFASSVLRHPILLTIDVRDCGANRGMASSIKLTTKFNYGEPNLSLHFDFKNVANGQISNFNYGIHETTHSMALPGGYYTFIAYYKFDAAPGAAASKSVQLLYDTPIAVPQITSSGLCLNVVDKRVK